MPKIKGRLVSEWSVAFIRTFCTLDTDTGELDADVADVPNDLGLLEKEYFEMPNGEEIPVCKTCHEFILRTAVNPSEADEHTLVEEMECSNPDCESRG